MASAILIDLTSSSEPVGEMRLSDLASTLTVRELISARVLEEVRHYNLDRPQRFRSLIQPTGLEAELNPQRQEKLRRVEPETHVKEAIEAFKRNRFFILVGDRQVESLDETIEVGIDTEISFLRLTPLVGG